MGVSLWIHGLLAGSTAFVVAAVLFGWGRRRAEKLASYGAANLLNQQKEIARFVTDPASPVWDQAAIERRHAELRAVAARLWSLDNL